jgi:hypothetical protein
MWRSPERKKSAGIRKEFRMPANSVRSFAFAYLLNANSLVLMSVQMMSS